MDVHVRNLAPERIECDEIWAFCYAKQKKVPEDYQGTPGYGRRDRACPVVCVPDRRTARLTRKRVLLRAGLRSLRRGSLEHGDVNEQNDRVQSDRVAQASGMVSVQAECSVAEAIALIEERAQMIDLTTEEVADSVVDRTFRFSIQR